MPVDWENFDVKAIAAQAAEQTDAELAAKVSSLTRMTDAEVKELFPAKSDVAQLAHLMKIVRSSSDENQKVTEIVANAEKFGGVIVTLLKKFVT